MKLNKTVLTLAFLSLASTAALAAQPARYVQRNANQQGRIEQGLKSGELTTREASRLEREQSAVETLEAKAARDGSVSAKEAARIDSAQDKASRDIYRQKHDVQEGDPNSASSRRMQADVARNQNQQERIAQGVASGELTAHEAARLERGQARSDHALARAGANGRVGVVEQNHIQRTDNRQNRRIFRQKHDVQDRN